MSRTRDVAVLYAAVLCSCKRSDGMAYFQRGMVVSERSAKRRADIGRGLRFQPRYHAPRPLYESTATKWTCVGFVFTIFRLQFPQRAARIKYL